MSDPEDRPADAGPDRPADAGPGRPADAGPGRPPPGPAGPGDTQPLPTLPGGSTVPVEPGRRDDGPPPGSAPPGEAAPPAGRARRFWSSRRVTSGITALLALAGTGLLLYDVAAVRAGRHAMRWRTRLADELATRPLDDTWVLTGAAVCAALGLWLLQLALSPGLRRILPLRPLPGPVRAGLDRDAAALVLRDRVLEVPGVRTARVSVSRRRAKVRVDSHFRDLDDVREDVRTVLGSADDGLGLARRLRLSVSVRRGGKE